MELATKFQSEKKQQDHYSKQKDSVMLIRSNESIILEQKQKNIIFTKLPARLVNIILEMIAPNEVPILRCVCKWFKQYIDSNENLVAIQVFSLFFPKQVDFFCDYGENDIFLEERVKKNYIMSHNMRNQSKWRQFLKIYEDVRENFLSSNYKIFLIAEEFKQRKKNDSQNHLDPIQLNTNKLNKNEQQLKTQFAGLQPLSDPDLSDGDSKEGEDLFGFGAISDQTPSEQKEETLFKFILGQEDEQKQMEQTDKNQENLFQINQKQQDNIQDTKTINPKSQNAEIKDFCDFNASQHKVKAQRISQKSSKYIWNVIKDPPLPILKLRRENIGNYCNTWFQNKLAEVLWEGSRQIGFGLYQDSEEDIPLTTINNIIRDNKEYFIKEIKETYEKYPQQKKNILNMRYYFYKQKPTYSYTNVQNKKVQVHSNSHIKLNSPKQFLDIKKQRAISIIDEYAGMSQSKGIFSSNTSTAAGGSFPLQNPVVFNFFQENKDNNESNNLFDTQNNFENCQQKEIFDDIFQFVNKSPEQEQEQDTDPFEGIKLNNSKEEKNGFEADELINMKQKPLLLHFMESLIDLFIFKCQLIYEYLKEHMSFMNESCGVFRKNGFDLLSEYNIMWNSYIAFLTEIEEQLKDVFEIFNEAFDSVFESYPQHPRMSIWRLMVKIWISEIYSKDELKQNLFGCFLKVLSIRRHENFQFQMKQIELDRKVQQQYYMPDQLEYISLTLLNNLAKNKNFSLLNYGEGYDYFHSFFSSNQYHVDSLLSNFVESTIDLSLNEISVHYLGHSCVQMDSPYLELEKQLLDSSQTYYRHQQSMFISNPSNYLLFLKGDLKYVSKIFKERSQVQLRKKMLEHWKEMFKDIITQKIPKQQELFQQKDEKARSLIQQHVKQNLQQLKIQQQAQIQNEINLNSPLNLLQQNTQSQDNEEQNLGQQSQLQQQQQQQIQQQAQVENIDQSPIRQMAFSKDAFPSLIYQILEEQEIKQKQQEQLKMELDSKSPSVETQQLFIQKTQITQINFNSNSDFNDLFSSEKQGNCSDNLFSGNQNNLNGMEQEIDEDLPQMIGFGNPQLEEKKDTSTKSNTTQQYLSLSIEEYESIQQKAHILAQMFRMSDDLMKTDVINYLEVCRVLIEISTTKSDQDLEIEELNAQRRLPMILNHEEQTFFFLTKQLTEDILGETIEKQREFLRQQRESNIDADSDEDEDNDEQNDDQLNEEDSEDDDEEQDNNRNKLLRFDDDDENSDDDIPNQLSLKPLKQKPQKKKKNKFKANQDQNIPVYNSGDESDSHNEETGGLNGNMNFFNLKKQESNASDFSLGLDKQQSRISNTDLFADAFNNIQSNQSNENKIEFKFNFGEPEEKQINLFGDAFNNIQNNQQDENKIGFQFNFGEPQRAQINFFTDGQNNLISNQSNENKIEFKFNLGEPEEEQTKFDPFKMEKQNSGLPNNQINMFQFKLQSNDVINIKSNQQKQPAQEKNYFAGCYPTVQQNNINSNNNFSNQIKLNMLSSQSNEYKETQNQQQNSQRIFFNLQNNINNNQDEIKNDNEEQAFFKFQESSS